MLRSLFVLGQLVKGPRFNIPKAMEKTPPSHEGWNRLVNSAADSEVSSRGVLKPYS